MTSDSPADRESAVPSDALLPSPRVRVAIGLFSVVLVVLVASPSWRDPPYDSFPLSDYPMFSHGRPDSGLRLTHVLGVSADGERRPLSPQVTSGNSEVLQSMMTIHRSVVGGRASILCDEIAGRVMADGTLSDVVAVEIATSDFDCVRYFDDQPEPLSRVVHVRCDVARGEP